MLLKYSQIGISGGLIAIAVVMVPVSTLGFELPKFAALACVSTCCAVAFLLRKQPVLAFFLRNVPGMLLFAYAGVTVLSLLWSVAPLTSIVGGSPRFHGVLAQICFLTLAVAAGALVRHQEGRKLLFRGLLAANVTVVLYGTLQMLELDPLTDIWASEAFLGRVFSTLGHPNTLGQFILLTVPFVGLTFVRSLERPVQLWWLMVIILNTVVLLGTVSRSALLGGALLTALCIPALKRWLRVMRSKIKTEQAFALSLIVVLCASVGFLFFAERFQHSFEPGRSSGARQVIWDGMAQMIAHRPVGWGLDTLAFTSPQFIGKELYKYESLTTVVDRAHNQFLQTLVTLGPLGLIIYASLGLSLIIAAWRQGGKDGTGILQAAGAGIAAFQVSLLFGFPSIATSAFYWILAGLIIGMMPGKNRPVSAWIEAAARWSIAAACMATIVVSVQWVQARWIHAYARGIAVQDPSFALMLHQEGLLTFRYDRQSITEAAEAHLLALETQPDNQDLYRSIETMITLLSDVTSGADGTAHLLSAWLAATQGDSQQAHKELAAAKPFYKASVSYHRAAAHILALLGDGAAVYEQQSAIRGLLPDAYFEEGSETQRILLKQHPWLKELTSDTPQ